MGEATRTGLVEGIELFEKGPGKAKVGGRSVRFWAKEYQSDKDSDVLELLRKAANDGLEATVVGEESTQRNAKGSYTQFMAKSVTLGGSTNGLNPASNGQPSNFVGRDPGLNDYWTAFRHAYSSAIDQLGGGRQSDEYLAVAKVIFHGVLEAAVEAKQGAGEAKEEGDGW